MKNHWILIILIVVVVGGLVYLQHGGLEQLETLVSSLDLPASDTRTAISSPRPTRPPQQWAQVAGTYGIVVRQRPDSDSMRLDMLLPQAVVGHFGSNGRGWLKVRTPQGQTGWIPESEMRVLGVDQARRAVDRDRLALERQLRAALKRAVSEKAKLMHPASRVIDYKIMSELKPQGEHLSNIEVCTLMKGNLLGLSQFRTDYAVTLQLVVNPYKLDASEINIVDVDIMKDEQTKGLPPGQVANLLGPVIRTLLIPG
ncbi:MAG TPA: SH3 domain-containing protein [Acidobacteriota bacterium]|nr:SH3 domain-containing protein [Acidobacteriota bacterium]